MTITKIGELTLAQVVPLLATFSDALTFAQGIAVGELEAKLAGLGNVLAAITVAPPALGATIEAAIGTVASLQAAVGGPTVTLQATAIAALIADLNASLATLTASVSIPSATVSAYVYDGPSANIGAELQAAMSSLPGSGPGDHANALILATTSSAAWTTMGRVFRL